MSEITKMSNGVNKLIPIGIAVAVAVGGGAFFGGMKYAASKAPGGNFPQESGGAPHAGGADGGRTGGGIRRETGNGFTAGEIISKDDKSITVKMRDSGSKIVFLSDSTEITKSAAGALIDLEVGKNVSINGTANADGSVTAQKIQLRPQLSNRQ